MLRLGACLVKADCNEGLDKYWVVAEDRLLLKTRHALGMFPIIKLVAPISTKLTYFSVSFSFKCATTKSSAVQLNSSVNKPYLV